MADVNKVVQVSSCFLDPQEYSKILRNITEDECMLNSPVCPQPGDIIVFFCKSCNEECEETCDHIEKKSWKTDGYAWTDIGIKHIPAKNPIVTCHYYANQGSKKFVKRAYHIFKNNQKYSGKTLIHYVGSLKDVEFLPHGKVSQNIASAQTSYFSGFHKPKLDEALRDPKHPSNTASNKRNTNRKLLSADDLVGLYAFSHEVGKFVRRLPVVPHFCPVLFSEEMSAHVNDLLMTLKGELLLSYTTFNLGEFYVSSLNMKHPHFEGEPTVPLAYLIHNLNISEVHRTFFYEVVKICPMIDGTDIVTDREDAINVAIQHEMPNSTNFYCWNHILQDANNWLKNTDIEDVVICLNNVWDLMNSDSFDDFSIKYEAMEKQWPEDFKNYFNENIKSAVVTSGKWILVKHNKYTTNSGIANNSAESMNKVLRNCIGLKELNLQVLGLTIYELDLHYQKELLKGYSPLRDFVLKPKYGDLRTKAENVLFLKPSIKLEKLPFFFLNNDFGTSDSEDEDEDTFSYAKKLVLNGNVKLIETEKCFLIKSLHRKKRFVVTLFPKETCSCQANKNCVHLIAAKMSIGLDANRIQKEQFESSESSESE